MSTLPLANQTGIATNSNVVVNFSEPVENVTAASFTVNDGGAVPGTITVSNGGMTWTFIPSGQMAGPAVVTVTLTTAITDHAGNPLAAPVYLMFATAGPGDPFGPVLNGSVPAANAGGVLTNSTIVLMFSEPVFGVNATSFSVSAGAAIAGTRIASNGGRTWTFTPSAALPSGATITVMLTSGIVDLDNVPLGPLTYTFTTQ